MMCKMKLKPSQLLQRLFDKVGPHYYDRIDTVIEAKEKETILKKLKANFPKKVAGIDVVNTNLSDGFKFMLKDGSWLLIRFSGTEPLVRIYSEALSKQQVQAILNAGSAIVLA